jgi:hypothetical protein
MVLKFSESNFEQLLKDLRCRLVIFELRPGHQMHSIRIFLVFFRFSRRKIGSTFKYTTTDFFHILNYPKH